MVPHVASDTVVPVTLPERADPPIVDMEVEQDVSLTDSAPPETHAEYDRRFKRPADVPTEQLEREMNEEAEGRMDVLETGLYWSDTGQPVLSSMAWSLDGPCLGFPATSSDMYDGSISSIQFNGREGHQSKTMELGGSTVLLWKPDAVIDDSTLATLDAQLGYEGMQEEIRNLNECRTGECMTESQVHNLRQKFPNARLITCRWVSAFKSDGRVRCRIVAKDNKAWDQCSELRIQFTNPQYRGSSLHLDLSCKSGILVSITRCGSCFHA